MAVYNSNSYGSSYGKRPLWQWILIYIVVGGIIYAAIYFLFFAKNGGYNLTGSSARPNVSQSAAVPSGNIIQMKTDPAKGTYPTDFQGMTLYTSSADSTGVSNCTGTCASNWPVYTSGATAQSILPANVTVITRTDGSKQFAWKGMPLYYFAGDSKVGDITGDGVATFHLAK